MTTGSLLLVLVTCVATDLRAQSLPTGWSGANIGNPALPGSVSYAGGVFTVEGSGADIWSTSDQLYFAYRQISGDVDIVARVADVENTHRWAKAGVMIRGSLNANAAHASMLVTPGMGLAFQWRSAANQLTQTGAGPTEAAPAWVKLERRGQRITSFSSTNGTTWTRIGSQSVTLPSTFYVGLADSSHNTAALATATFDNVVVQPVAALPLPTLPPGWSGADIGLPLVPGSGSESNGTFTISGSGRDIWGTSDQFFFAYKPVTGDVDVIARVATVENVNAWTKSGIMVRASLAANSAHASLLVSPGNGRAFQRRPTTGATSLHTAAGTGPAPAWFKLERRGSAVTAFTSTNGTTWTMTDSQALTLPSTFYVGLAVSSHVDLNDAIATIDNVVVQAPTASNQPPTAALTAPANGATYTAPATINLAATATDPDDGVAQVEFFSGQTLIGTDTTSPYTATWSNVPAGTYTLTAVARDQSGATTTSAARTVTVSAPADTTPPTAAITSPANGASVSGTVTVSANASDNVGVAFVTFRVDGTVIGSADTTAPYSVTWNTSGAAPGSHTLTAEAGDAAGNRGTSPAVTVTVPAANQPPTASLTAPANGATFTAPATISVAANASDPDDGVAQVEFFAGQTLIATDTTSPYAATWSNVPAGSYSLTAVARDRTGATTTSAARMITVQGAAPTNWTGADIGNPSLRGSVSESGGVLTVDGTGDDIEGTSDQFFFVYRAVSGDLDVIARVASEEPVDPWTKAGPMIRSSLAANSAHTSLFITPGNGVAFQRRASDGAMAVHAGAGTGTAPVWMKLERRGTAITAFRSPDGTTWSMVGSQAMTLPQTFYVGMAVTVGNTSELATVVFDNITVRPVTAGPQPPAVALTAPADGATFSAPATINLTANASDGDDGVSQVQFFAGQTLIGTDTTSPYTATWSNVPVGTYTLTAVARDQGGLTTTSAARTVTVTTTTNQPPTVAVTAPANGATFTAPASVTISANAADTDGTVARVDFYNGTTLLGSDTTSPYSFAWSNVPAGTYSLTAVARDNAGAQTTSAARSITVNNAPAPTRALFNASTNHDTAVTNYRLDIFTNGADPNTATPVQTQNLGKPAVANGAECDVDIATTIQSLPGGSYIATVTAIGPGGNARSATSAPFTR